LLGTPRDIPGRVTWSSAFVSCRSSSSSSEPSSVSDCGLVCASDGHVPRKVGALGALGVYLRGVKGTASINGNTIASREAWRPARVVSVAMAPQPSSEQPIACREGLGDNVALSKQEIRFFYSSHFSRR